MPEIIKQISVYDGSSWGTKDIGANAGNILLSSNIAGSTNLQTALGNILPASQLSAANQVLIADSNKKIATSGVSATQLGYLSGVTSGIQAQINSLNSNFINAVLTYTAGKTYTDEVQLLIDNGYITDGKPFVGWYSHGISKAIYGFFYSNFRYGACLILISTGNAVLVSRTNGEAFQQKYVNWQ